MKTKLSQCQKIKKEIENILPQNWGVLTYFNGTHYTAKLFIKMKNDITVFPKNGKISIPISANPTQKIWQEKSINAIKNITHNYNEAKELLKNIQEQRSKNHL